MEGKKLNIQFDENVLGSIDDNNTNYNSWEILTELLMNSLASRREIQGITKLIQQKDNHIKDVEDKLSELQIKLSAANEKVNMYMAKIKDKNNLIATESPDSTSINTKLDKLMEEFSTIKNKLQNTENEAQIKAKDNQIALLNSKVNVLEVELKKSKSQIVTHESTIKKLNENNRETGDNKNEIQIFTRYGTSTKLMHVPGLDPFTPTEEDKIAGPGWIVMQRRIDGSVSFDRDLEAYIAGFGNPLGEFWLGLERLHRITNHQQHELYIQMVNYSNETHYARYDNFVVDGKHQKYALKSLGHYTGDNRDMLRVCEKNIFLICKNYKMGVWALGNSTPQCNLNGNFSATDTNHCKNIFWGFGQGPNDYKNIKSVQMLIRPLIN